MENGLIGTAIFLSADFAAALVIWKMLGNDIPGEQWMRARLARWISRR